MKFDLQSLTELIANIELEMVDLRTYIKELDEKKQQLEAQLHKQKHCPPPGVIKKALRKLGMFPKLTKDQRREDQRQISKSKRQTTTECTPRYAEEGIPQTA
tara:strand:+ start:414 stop:719 length:306 start_codon:yes stop_codon:yes gene_type:complete